MVFDDFSGGIEVNYFNLLNIRSEIFLVAKVNNRDIEIKLKNWLFQILYG